MDLEKLTEQQVEDLKKALNFKDQKIMCLHCATPVKNPCIKGTEQYNSCPNRS